MSKKIIEAGLFAAFHEGQQYRQRAKQRALPSNPTAWLDDAEAYARGLPDNLPQKPVIQDQVRLARRYLAEGNVDEAKFYLLQIEENHANAEHDKFVLGVEGSLELARAKNAEKLNKAVPIMVATIVERSLKKGSHKNRPILTKALKEAGISPTDKQYKSWLARAFSQVHAE